MDDSQIPAALDPNAQPAAPAVPGVNLNVGAGQMSINPYQDQAAQQVQAQTADAQAQQAQAPQVTQQPQIPVPTPQSIMAEKQGLVDKEKAISGSMSDAGVQKAKFDADSQRQYALELQKWQAADMQKQKAREDKINDVTTDLAKTQSDYQKFLASPDAKVKTNNLWENMGTGQKILAGISLALGAVGAGNTGKNGAVDIINNAISRDIDAQKQNITLQAQGKLQNYNMQNNLYAQMLKKYQNEDMAEAATRLLRTQQVQAQMNAVASDSQGLQTQAQKKWADAQLDESMLQLKTQFAEAARQDAYQKSLGITPEMRALGTLPKEYQERYVPGYGVAANKENADYFQKEDRSRLETPINQIDTIMQQAQDLNRVADPAKRAALQTRLGATSLGLIDALSKSKRFNEEEMDRIKNILGDPTKFTNFSSLAKARLQTMRSILANELDDAAAKAGLPRKNKQIKLNSLDKPE